MYNNYMLADMHTHSRFSHDSECFIEEMCISQIKKGTNIFAVTDHCDVYSFKDYDIFTPIIESFNEVELLNQKYGDRCLLLSGIEISEGFWFPELYEKIHNLLSFDVIISSVHCVKYKNLNASYSTIDFTRLSENEINKYLYCYFNDIIEMLEKTDFNILAHLTCPLRYINGKFGININMEKYNEQILKIFNIIIERNIALEINTSSFKVINDFMPSVEIIKMYHSLGGQLITIGSDAHIADNASVNFDKATEILKEIGFEKIYYFKNKKAKSINI